MLGEPAPEPPGRVVPAPDKARARHRAAAGFRRSTCLFQWHLKNRRPDHQSWESLNAQNGLSDFDGSTNLALTTQVIDRSLNAQNGLSDFDSLEFQLLALASI